MKQTKTSFLTLEEVVLFGLFPALMLGTQMALSALPNFHLTGVFIVILTRLFRGKALIPLYVYVLLAGFYIGFNIWWIPYLYIWTALWAMAMLIPKKLSKKWEYILCTAVCGLHGFLFGSLWALSQPLLTDLPWKSIHLYILSGLSFDIAHGISNTVLGTLISPICRTLRHVSFHRKKKDSD